MDDYIDSSVVDVADYVRLLHQQFFPDAEYELTHPQPWRLGWNITIKDARGNPLATETRKTLQKRFDERVIEVYREYNVLVECTLL